MNLKIKQNIKVEFKLLEHVLIKIKRIIELGIVDTYFE